MKFIQKCARGVIGAVLGLTILGGIASAQSIADTTPDNCQKWSTPNGNFTITSQADADALSNCTDVLADIIIQSDSLSILNLTGIETIYGSLTAANCANLSRITSNTLKEIRGNLTLSSLPSLLTIDFLKFHGVVHGLYLDNLPVIDDYIMSDTLANEGNLGVGSLGYDGTNVVSITRTALNQLDFLDFTNFTRAAGSNITIKDNSVLYKIELQHLETGPDTLNISNNSPKSQVSFPNMESAAKIYISGANNIQALELTSTAGDFIVTNNSFTEYGQFMDYRNMDFPKLQSVGGNFIIENNRNLDNVAGTPQLVNVWGDVNITGYLQSVLLPNIGSVHGLHINTTAAWFDCTDLDIRVKNMSGWPDPLHPNYNCAAWSETQHKDYAIHYKPPKKQIPKAALVVVIIASVILGILALTVLLRWWRDRVVRRAGQREREWNEDVELEDGGAVVRVNEEGEDGPPRYERVGKPGEVPPGYAESVGESMRTGNNGARGATNGVTLRPHPRSFFHRVWAGDNRVPDARAGAGSNAASNEGSAARGPRPSLFRRVLAGSNQ